MVQKRASDDSALADRKSKKAKLQTAHKEKAEKPAPAQPSILSTEEIDFPRGGGSSFTPLEFKAIRTEAIKEANEELFKVGMSLCLEFVRR